MVQHLNRQGHGKIEWTDYTWNPVSGCEHGCSYCYLKRIPGFDMTPAFHPEKLSAPSKLKVPSMIFVTSSGDLFGEWVPDNWIDAVIEVIGRNPWHTFQLLTKNPGRYRDFEFPHNAWLGTTIDTGENLGVRAIELTRKSKTNVTYLSFEPMLTAMPSKHLSNFGVKWVIIGGRTGRHAFRPPWNWVWDVVGNCRKQGIAVFVKDNAGYPEEVKEYPKKIRLY